ncbi:DHHC zinc finger domain-containing protein [Babesia caballi]|uniref:Palmitoyltransferase n=1 Tax=Babesia caballi TaxID=5871 RepID=A0AAV4LX83_BABCB|nr:DHHC zinc finger domain-containing protein [Babesia caballi]
MGLGPAKSHGEAPCGPSAGNPAEGHEGRSAGDDVEGACDNVAGCSRDRQRESTPPAAAMKCRSRLQCCGDTDLEEDYYAPTGFRLSVQRTVDGVRRVMQQIADNERLVRGFGTVMLYCPYVFFAASALWWYATNVSTVLAVIPTLLAAVSLGCFHVVSHANPGIIPKQADTYEAFDAIRMKRKYSHAAPCIELAIAGKFLRVKYCHTCNLYRPPRTVHCSVCDVCVHRFDHHCKWLGNCVGGNNYRPFYGFLVVTTVEAVLLLALSIARLVLVSHSTKEARSLAESSVLLGYIMLSGWFVAGLTVYHTYLVWVNKTTNEHLKALYVDYNPWDRGVVRNFLETVFAHTKTRLLRATATVAAPMYDPGRSVPRHLNAPYVVVRGQANDRRQAFDSGTSDRWEASHGPEGGVEDFGSAPEVGYETRAACAAAIEGDPPQQKWGEEFLV